MIIKVQAKSFGTVAKVGSQGDVFDVDSVLNLSHI
jgi:hypothetical protein